MAAKKIETWTVATTFADQMSAEAFAVAHTKQRRILTEVAYVCPHCGGPWPTLDDGSLFTEDQYRRNVESQRFRVDSYCCDATGRDCATVND